MNDYIAFLILGVPSWAVVDGTWSLLSEIAENQPEGYNISAYLMLALTLGNIFPLLVGYLLEHSTKSQLKRLILVILAVGLTTSILLAICWNDVVTISSTQLSLPLYILFFIVGVCSSTSNVTHFMFVSSYDASCTTGLAVGMGIGSMISGVLAIIQGFFLADIGYSPSLYFATLALLYVPSLYVVVIHTKIDNADSSQSTSRSAGSYEVLTDQDTLVKEEQVIPIVGFNFSSFLQSYKSLLCIHLLSCSMGYGLVPALISYACGRFAGRDWVLLLATGLYAVINPWSRYVTDYYRLESIQGLWQGAAWLGVLTFGLLLCATLPANLALYQGAGGILPIILYVAFGCLFGYTNTCVYRYLKEHAVPSQVQGVYRCFGIASQTGALLGSLIAFTYVICSST
ncbi:hypothetical protein EON65_14145 [archaeon]|nr:MAG: hypothetical protein EON65_14145 [archaeon]